MFLLLLHSTRNKPYCPLHNCVCLLTIIEELDLYTMLNYVDDIPTHCILFILYIFIIILRVCIHEMYAGYMPNYMHLQ